MTCRHLTVLVSIHLMTCTFDNVSIHLMTYTFDSVCVDPSHDNSVMYYYWMCLSSHLMTCRHIWQMCSSHDLQTLLTVFVSFHLMTCRHFWQCLCPSISWPADTFDSVCVLPSHDLQTLLTVFVSIHLMTSDTFNSVCVHPSHDLQTPLTVFVSVHLMTWHFWQCLCPSISWPADTFDSVFVHLMTCTLLTVCLHPSHDLQTLLTVFVSRQFWQFLCPSILWPADIFDSGFTSIHLMTFRHFLRWALLSLDNTTFSFSILYKLFPGYNLILMSLFCISGTMTKTCSPHVVPKFDDARESSRALVDDKSPRQLQTKEQKINWLPKLTLCGWQDTKNSKIQLLTKCHNFVLAQFKVENACTYCNIKWLYNSGSDLWCLCFYFYFCFLLKEKCCKTDMRHVRFCLMKRKRYCCQIFLFRNTDFVLMMHSLMFEMTYNVVLLVLVFLFAWKGKCCCNTDVHHTFLLAWWGGKGHVQ